MLKAIVSYSKKIPVEGKEYSSQGYSLSLEAEIPDTEPSAIRSKLHGTFELVKDQVEHELANGNSKMDNVTHFPQHGERRANANTGKATNRQIKFITDLANQQGLALSELNAKIRKRFGLDGLYDLSKHQASTVLDLMKKAA